MDNNTNKEFDLYKDIQARTNGEIYIGVVGPVRTGKSTFIKRFMDLMVLPNMLDEHEKERAQDELPQSSGGKTITTTEPKFVPKEAAKVQLAEDVEVSVRLIDCVGYMVDGAVGHMEEDTERMVKTPWFTQEIPFTQAALVGTDKVIRDHSTFGLVITTDGSITDLPRGNYIDAEEKTIDALKAIHKPFFMILNSTRPFSEETKKLANDLKQKYQITVLPVNCEQMKKDDILMILEKMLDQFPLTAIEFYLPKWVEMLSNDNRIKSDIIRHLNELRREYRVLNDVREKGIGDLGEYVKQARIDQIEPQKGIAKVNIVVDQAYYYEMLGELTGEPVDNEYQLIARLKEYSRLKDDYKKVLHAVNSVRGKGYGVVTPDRSEIHLEKPELIRHGNKYGVKIKAESPSIHMIRANIETEIAPIVGTEEQAKDLITYIENTGEVNGIWDTNIFGKTIEQLVEDGIMGKIAMIGDESQTKLQDTMQKIVNDSNGGMVCIII